MSKYIIILVLIIGVSFFAFRSISNEDLVEKNEDRVITVAVCPTMYDRFLNLDGFELIKVESTAQAVSLLKEGRAQYVLSGRVPKLEEGIEDFVILEEGLSFLSDEEQAIYIDDLLTMSIYADIEVSNEFQKVEYIDDVYNYIDDGILVTSWENTDYSRANIVHVLNEDGSRWIGSRTPVLYCKEECDLDLVNYLKNYGNND